MNAIERMAGTYEGDGQWHDAKGKSMAYTVRQTNLVTAAGFEIEFTHEFEDGTITQALFVLTWITPYIFRVDIGGNPVGNGYCVEDCCKLHIKAGETYVETSYRPKEGRLEVGGSSTKNAEGNYIVWHEHLRLTGGGRRG